MPRYSEQFKRDAVLVERISAIHRDNYGIYGVRKMWHALRREGIDIGREQTARLTVWAVGLGCRCELAGWPGVPYPGPAGFCLAGLGAPLPSPESTSVEEDPSSVAATMPPRMAM